MDVDPRRYEPIAIKDSDIHSVVLSYLVHNCYKETVESFAASTGISQPPDCLDDMEKRKRISCYALEGNVLKAIELTEEIACDLLANNMDLHFDLLSLHFVELICSRKSTDALEFAQTKLRPFGEMQKYVEKLQDFMALLAYEEPEKSPMFHLLSMEYRQHVADNLNRALLAHSKQPSYSAMERLIQQTAVSEGSTDAAIGEVCGISKNGDLADPTYRKMEPGASKLLDDMQSRIKSDSTREIKRWHLGRMLLGLLPIASWRRLRKLFMVGLLVI